MLKLPAIPNKAGKGMRKIFKRRREYTKLDKLRVYNMLFDAQVLESEIEQAKKEITENQKIKEGAFDLLFR